MTDAGALEGSVFYNTGFALHFYFPPPIVRSLPGRVEPSRAPDERGQR